MERGVGSARSERERAGGEVNASVDRWRGSRAVASTDDSAQLCICTPLHPTGVATAACTLSPRQHPCSSGSSPRSLFLSSPPFPFCPLFSSLPLSLSLSLLFVLRPIKSPRFSPLSLPSRVSRPSRPGPRATTESTTSASRGRMLRAAPVNVTLKTEGACTHSPHPAAVAPRGGAVSYVRM